MVIAALLSRDTITIQRKSTTQDADGGINETFNTANRGALPTSANCRAQEMSANENIEFGISGNNIGWKFLCPTDPQIDERDQIVFTDSQSVSHTIDVLGKQRNADNQGIMFQVNGEEKSTKT